MRRSQNKPEYSRLRSQLFAAPRAQGTLAYRVLLYCCLTALVTAGCFEWAATLRTTTPTWYAWTIPVLFALLLTVPIAIYDMAVVSNRIVGPIARVHGAVRRLANRDAVHPLRIRSDDEWEEWIQDFNIMLSRVQARQDTFEYAARQNHAESLEDEESDST